MMQDRSEGDELLITREFLAEMLGFSPAPPSPWPRAHSTASA